MTDAASAPGDRRGGLPARVWLGIVAFLLLVAAAIYIWRLVSVDQLRDAMAAQRDSVSRAAEERIEARTADLLRLSGVPLGFAIREPMMEGNYGLVDQYLSDLVQEPGLRRAVVAGPGDSILVATDRNLRGRRFSEAFPRRLLGVSETTVAGEGDTSWVVVPLTGINRRLGVLLVEYVHEDAGADTARAGGRGAPADSPATAAPADSPPDGPDRAPAESTNAPPPG